MKEISKAIKIQNQTPQVKEESKERKESSMSGVSQQSIDKISQRKKKSSDRVVIKVKKEDIELS